MLGGLKAISEESTDDRNIVENCLHTNYRICSQRSSLNRLLDSFFYCREVVLRNSSAYNLLLKYIGVSRSPAGSKHLYMTVLAMAAGLFLIFCFHICILADRLAKATFGFTSLPQYLFGEDLLMIISRCWSPIP